MVDRLRRFGGRARIERELGELLADQGAVAAIRLGDPVGEIGPEDQPLGPRHFQRQPVGITCVGDIARESKRFGRAERQLQEPRGGLQRAGDQRHRIARNRRFEQRLDRLDRLVARRLDQDPASVAEHRDRGRLVGEPRRIGLQLRAIEVDPLRAFPHRRGERLHQRAAAGLVGPVQQEEASLARRAERLVDLGLVRLHCAAAGGCGRPFRDA